MLKDNLRQLWPLRPCRSFMAPVAMQGAEHNVEHSHRCHEGCTHQNGVCRYLPTVSPHHLQDESPLVAGKGVQGTHYHSQQVYLQPWLTDSLLLNYGWHLAPKS